MLTVWVFVANDGEMPSGVFSGPQAAEEWIKKNRLSGLLTEYPVDVGIMDWAMQYAGFRPPAGKSADPSYIGRFTSGALNHFHYENGGRAV